MQLVSVEEFCSVPVFFPPMVKPGDVSSTVKLWSAVGKPPLEVVVMRARGEQLTGMRAPL